MKKKYLQYQPYDKSLKKLLKKQINYRGKATLSFGLFPCPLLHRKMHFIWGQILRILAESWCHYLWVSALLSKTVERANTPYRFWNRHFLILKQKLSFLFTGFCLKSWFLTFLIASVAYSQNNFMYVWRTTHRFHLILN